MSDELVPPVAGSSMKAAPPRPPSNAGEDTGADTPKAAKKAPPKKAAAKKAPTKKAVAKTTESESANGAAVTAEAASKPKKKAAAKKAPAKKAADTPAPESDETARPNEQKPAKKAPAKKAGPAHPLLFQAPEPVAQPRRRKPVESIAEQSDQSGQSTGQSSGTSSAQGADDKPSAPRNRPAKKTAAPKAQTGTPNVSASAGAESVERAEGQAADRADGADGADGADDSDTEDGAVRRRPRRRGGRRRRKPAGAGGDADGNDSSEGAEDGDDVEDDPESDGADNSAGESEDGGTGPSRRTRTRNRAPKSLDDEIASVNGSTRLEAKKQRRREGREAGRRRAPIVSEAEFLARREAVDRVMLIRQRDALTQIGVLEDNVLVEHYVSRESQTSMIGNVYLGRVQNVLPSMEAAFIDIGKGRNAVLYAGEVNWSGLGHKDGQPRKIESVLSSGQTVLVQVTKDPVGQKGARLTSQISIPGRFLVYVPDGTTSGISRKLADTERSRLKALLKEIVPNTAGVIVRTAAEGASEEELTLDVERLTLRWADIEAKVAAGKSPDLLYGEPDLTLKVVRDLFTEDFTKLVIQGDEAWELVQQYVEQVAPDLAERLERFEPDADGPPAARDLFVAYRVDEQIAKGLDRKVWLPSGGSLIIDRTEAMTVVDVNTGKFTGSGGNLEETVTKNNLEAAEEMVRQLRLRDIGGIIVIDFIDMVLESNRDLVLRRLVECLGRDRTRHQVAEVTSLGLVQMTRKRIGTGLVEAFSEECTHCKGRGVIVHHEPIATAGAASVSDDEPRGNRRRGQRRGRTGDNDQPDQQDQQQRAETAPSPANLAGSRTPVEPLPMFNQTPDNAEIAQVDVEIAEVDPEIAQVDAEVAQVDVETAAVVVESVRAEPAAPVVVTSTRRRRTATRPAGPPTSAAPEGARSAEVVVVEEATAPIAEDAAHSDEPVQAHEQPVEVDEATEPEALPELPEFAENDAEPGDQVDGEYEHSVLHVPIKKRGTRKR